MPIIVKQFKIAMIAMAGLEALSLISYYLPFLSSYIFIFTLLGFLFASLYHLEYGVFIALGELFIGSKGYLLSLEIGGLSVSVRIAFWLILISVWAGDTIFKSWHAKKIDIKVLNSKFFSTYILLGIFIFWGLINGILNKNEFSNIFFDFNAWLFFLYLFVFFSLEGLESLEKKILAIMSASVVWLLFKSLLLLFLFSHFNPESMLSLYRWVRVTGVGEVTRMESGFYRIFMQSHIFSLALFFMALWPFSSLEIVSKMKKSKKIFLIILATASLVNILISFSRSYWFGLATGLIFFFGLAIYRRAQFKILFKNVLLMSSIALLSFLLIAIFVKFPYPKPTSDFSASDLATRAGTLSGEAGVSSRWSLLPILFKEIIKSPILGKGYGATVTYRSSDPRVLNSSADGNYTTYAFEWGWLDIWLKLGIFGLIAYLYLLLYHLLMALKLRSGIIDAMTIALVTVIATSFFSPYMNHPLGIGFLILYTLFINQRHEKKLISDQNLL